MASEAHVDHPQGGERAPRSADAVLATLAGHQHGVVTRRQLLAAGVGRRAIERRVEWGLLDPLYRGVYALGRRTLRREAWWMAAVFAAGPAAALSHRSAAELWHMRNGSRARIEVSVPRHPRSTGRLLLHQVVLPGDEVLEGEPLDRLAQRRAADAELAHQLVLAQDRPRRQLQRHDPVAQLVVGPLGDEPVARPAVEDLTLHEPL